MEGMSKGASRYQSACIEGKEKMSKQEGSEFV